MDACVFFWFRRDLRLEDNLGLYRALTDGRPVVPVFIFDTDILSRLKDRGDGRVNFIHRALTRMQAELTARGSGLTVLHGRPEEVLIALAERLKPAAVYTCEDYEPAAIARDAAVGAALRARGISFLLEKDQVVFAPGEVLKSDGTPYTVFTPYSRAWHHHAEPRHLASVSCAPLHERFMPLPAPPPLPSLEDLGFRHDGRAHDLPVAESLDIDHYDTRRDRPDWEATTRLGPHLRFGTVSVRRLARWGGKRNATWLNQLIWRDFFFQILERFPHVVDAPFRPKYSLIPWRDAPEDFARWCAGTTGYPLVDAGMRQLAETGYMHNRVRMVVASFLCKHLLIDWRLGEAWFAEKLMDFDLAANNGNWQWAAGTGCDAAPYFRVFNPWRQQEKFDPQYAYVRRWVPEWGTPAYPKPMVDHASARKRALEAYQTGIAVYEASGGGTAAAP